MSQSNGIKPGHLKVDVSGTPGRDAVDGSDGYSYGSDGSDATKATPGTDAGRIELDMVAGSDGSLEVKGSATKVTGERSPVHGKLAPGSGIGLLARGGRGGHGGQGGDGARGRSGRDGMNASRYMSGTSGENGGPGGDGGHGSSGEDGGVGGRIDVRVKAGDTDYLAMIDQVEVRGGEGGKVGRHGEGGPGGRGGDGGSSYTWTETDSNGNLRTGTQMGGSDGYRGRSGSSPSTRLQSGTPGDDGRVRYHVEDANGQIRTYEDRYRMHVNDAQIVSDNHDGIVEPGEGARVSLDVANRGPMPTPSREATVRLDSNGHVDGSRSRTVLKPSIAPGARQHLAGIRVSARPVEQPAQGERYSARATLDSTVEMSRAQRALPESETQTPFEITYPVEISAVGGDRTATASSPAQIHWKVTNISSKPLGSASESARMVESYLRAAGGDVTPDMLEFVDESGFAHPLHEGIGRALGQLGPGQTVEIRGAIRFTDRAPPYSRVELVAGLDLGRLGDGADPQTIQKRSFSVQLARSYVSDPEARMLVVVNAGTSKEEIAAWEALAEQMGTKASVWNVSLYGAVSLTEAIGDVNLGEEFAGKTVVFLNNELGLDGTSHRPLDSLASGDLLRVAVEKRASTYVVGESVAIEREMSAPVRPPDQDHESVGDFLDAVDDDEAAVSQPLHSDQMVVEARGRPSRTKLDEAARELEEELREREPEQRFRVTAQYSPEAVEDSWFSWAWKHRVGTLKVDRSADRNQHVVMMMQSPSGSSAGFVTSLANRYAVAKAMPFPEKLRLLDHALTPEGADMREVAVRVILSDIAEEQQTLRQGSFNWELSNSEIREKLSRLSSLSKHFANVSKGTPQWDMVVSLVPEIRHMMAQSTSNWDRALPFRLADDVSDVGDDILDDLVGRAVSWRDRYAAWKDMREVSASLEERDQGLSEEQKRGMTPYLRPKGFWSPRSRSDFDTP